MCLEQIVLQQKVRNQIYSVTKHRVEPRDSLHPMASGRYVNILSAAEYKSKHLDPMAGVFLRGLRMY